MRLPRGQQTIHPSGSVSTVLARLLLGASWWAGLLLVVLLAVFESAACGSPVDADVLLQGGLIFDGTGSEGTSGDVAIRGERIVAVGRFESGKVDRLIKCRGLVIAPGFIDLHTHSDCSIYKPKMRANLNYMTQGCTTVVTGNCGGGRGDVGKFLDQIDEHGAGTNVIHLLPHGPVRKEVIGNANRPPTAEELQRMKELVAKGMREGAWGISTGLIYVPSLYADTDELVELSKVVARHGGLYVSHIRNEGPTLKEAICEAIEIGRRANLPVHISHFKVCGKQNWGRLREAAKLIEQARRGGQIVTADQYPYIATATSLAAILMPVVEIPGGWNDLSARMEADPALQRRVRKVISKQLLRSDRILINSCGKHPRFNGKSLAEIAAEEKISELDVVLRIHRDGGASAINFSISEEDMRYAMGLPWVATASDGQASLSDPSAHFHPRNFGTFPRKVGRYALGHKVLSLARAIRSCSGLPADILGLEDRGYLRAGTHADVLVFDPKCFIDQATFTRPQLYSTGVRYLFVAGQVALEDGKPSQRLHGRAIRHRSKHPARPTGR